MESGKQKINCLTMKAYKILAFFFSLFLAIGNSACSSDGPVPIRYGQEQCTYCKMTISDARFGSQIVTLKGRAYNFDDVHCMIAFLKAGVVEQSDIKEIYLPDYSNDNKLYPANQMFLLKSESLKSPMLGNIAAFISETDLQAVREIHGGEVLKWADLLK